MTLSTDTLVRLAAVLLFAFDAAVVVMLYFGLAPAFATLAAIALPGAAIILIGARSARPDWIAAPALVTQKA